VVAAEQYAHHRRTRRILVDTTITYDQVDRLADWVERFGKQSPAS
jgi:hypothetical protein